MSKESDRQRVYEIYGIPEEQRGIEYEMHHICFRSDPWVDSEWVDSKSNLIPLRADIHNRVHKMVRDKVKH